MLSISKILASRALRVILSTIRLLKEWHYLKRMYKVIWGKMYESITPAKKFTSYVSK